MLKTSRGAESKTKPGEGRIGVSGSRAGREESKLDGSELCGGEIDGGEIGGGEVKDEEIGKKVQKCKNLSKFKKAVRSDFFTPGAKLAFTKLRQAFFKAPILHHFNPKRHIGIEINAFGYIIGGVLS